jgi:catalase
VKFKTEDGNWDLVGNNLPVFFIRDAIKFPDVIHSLKPDPVTFRQEPNRIFDFMSNSPESMHMLSWLFSPRGIPKDYRHMDGFGVNTYKMVNADGDAVLVKYHWKTQQGIESLTQAQANEVQATDLGHASKDIFEAIERGDFPRWELNVQIMPDGEHPELDFDPLDDTKTWPEDQFPLRPVGMMTLNRNVENFFAENEQVAFGTGVLVDGLDFSDDKMLVGRTFSYSDTQRYRVGPNYLQLPINQPIDRPATNQRDGQMAYYVDTVGQNPHVNYEPNSLGGLEEASRLRPGAPAGRRGAGRAAAHQPAQRLRPGRRALPHDARVGARGPRVQHDRPARPVRPAHPGADGRAPRPVRHRLRQPRGRWPGRARTGCRPRTGAGRRGLVIARRDSTNEGARAGAFVMSPWRRSRERPC